jgi:bifunctional DNA primase/polymerase-like protein
MGSFVDVARKQYDDMGFDSLPVIGGGKKPIARAWQRRLPYRLWQNAPENANIGIRGGGLANVAFIDCDEPRSFENVTNYLAGLGYHSDSYPVVQTASIEGRHVYITLAGVLSGDARKLSEEVGAGEFRYGAGAMVVAPPSVIIDGGKYALISGDFSIRPELEVKDIFPILCNHETVTERKPTLSRKAVALLHGRNIDSYSSRSEAEQSLIASMVNAGFSFGEVLDLFNRYPCAGKYAELKAKNAKNAERWLLKSYNEAEQWTKTHESKARQAAKSAIAWAESTAWQGRTGAVDQLIYLAHANIAYKAGRLIYAASCRDLAELAGISHMTATRATWRLCKSGLLVPDKKAVADSANNFQLGNLDIPLHSLSTSFVRKCNTTSNHDVFRHRGLGKSAGQVWQALQEHPATIAELAKITGRHVKTVKRVIHRMAKLTHPLTGEYMPMVASDDGETYYSLSVVLSQVAHAVGTAGAGERQRKEHTKDRRTHARELERGRQARQS